MKIGNFLLHYTSNIPINSLIYLSSVFKILRQENKIFQDLRISADLADSALGYHGIFEGRKVGYITYLKFYIKIRVNTMDKDHNGRRAFDLSGKSHFFADSVISAESIWPFIFGLNKCYTVALLYDIKFRITLFEMIEPSPCLLFFLMFYLVLTQKAVTKF